MNAQKPLEVAAIQDPVDAGKDYRFEHLSLGLGLHDISFSSTDPAPGDPVPAFDLPTLAGGRFRSSDPGETGPALLVFGSYTCPVTDNAAPGLKDLHARFGDRVRFVMVDVREAHPGKSAPQPQTFDQKLVHAERLRELHGLEYEVAVDDIDGTLHRALSPKPNSAYLLDQAGIIQFRALWANDSHAQETALAAVTAGQSPRISQSGGSLRPMLRLLHNVAPVLDRAGSGAWRDLWLAATPLAAIGFAFKTLGIRPKN